MQAPSEWSQMAVHVVAELERLSNAVERLDKDLTAFRIEVNEQLAMVKVRTGVLWGAVGAAASAAVALAIGMLH